jgi:SET and MYND domain-containing protein 4
MASKLSEISENSRNTGNKLYIQRNFFDALVKYNESLCHAKPDSEQLGLAYANRSAVYFEMKMFENSLRNIELAKLNGYPEKNLSTLTKRAEKCLQQIENGNIDRNIENPFEFVKLSHEPHDHLPFVSNCLELKKSKKFGRYIITNCELKVGEIVAIEKPHFRILKSDSRYESCDETNKFQRCAYCLQDNYLDLIPCIGCSSTMFCSEECQMKAFESFHNYECLISGFLLKSGIMQMAIRVFFQALNMFNGSIEEIENFLVDKTTSSASYYDYDFSSKSTEMNKNFLTILYCLTKNNRSGNDSPEVLFKRHPILTEMWQNHESFITKFIQRILQIGDSNFHGICGWSMKKYNNQSPNMIGIGCYPFISLVNHSCAPNVNRIYIQDKMFLLVERPIKKGEQLFDCYK